MRWLVVLYTWSVVMGRVSATESSVPQGHTRVGAIVLCALQLALASASQYGGASGGAVGSTLSADYPHSNDDLDHGIIYLASDVVVACATVSVAALDESRSPRYNASDPSSGSISVVARAVALVLSMAFTA